MSKTSIFIEKARAKHGNRYDYGRVVYVSNSDKVIITCKKHGDFEQTPSNHLRSSGCAKCGRESAAIKQAQESKDNFIEKARDVHGDKYSYDRVVYVRSKDKVIITCAKHGDFEQTPTLHLRGHGCARCGFEVMAMGRSQEAKDSFIEKARALHRDQYSYLKTVYVHSSEKVIITCRLHGDFEQPPSDHLKGYGCARCAWELKSITRTQKAKDSFLVRCRVAHGDKYDYSKVVYDSSQEKVIITCKQHGDFEQVANNHLHGSGCPLCPARYDQPTNLYLMHNGLGKVKVGYSIDTDKRIKELNRDSPFEAELLETWTLPDTPTVRKIEGKVHRKLSKYHAGLSGFEGATEWFNTSPDRARGAILKALSAAEVLGHNIADSQQLALL